MRVISIAAADAAAGPRHLAPLMLCICRKLNSGHINRHNLCSHWTTPSRPVYALHSSGLDLGTYQLQQLTQPLGHGISPRLCFPLIGNYMLVTSITTIDAPAGLRHLVSCMPCSNRKSRSGQINCDSLCSHWTTTSRPVYALHLSEHKPGSYQLRRLMQPLHHDIHQVCAVGVVVTQHRRLVCTNQDKLHQPGIEPGSHRWQRCILPLDH